MATGGTQGISAKGARRAIMTRGFGHVYIETHNCEAAAAFWQRLGFELEFETDHRSGRLRNSADGSTIFLAEQPIEDPLGMEIYLSAAAGYEPPADVHV